MAPFFRSRISRIRGRPSTKPSTDTKTNKIKSRKHRKAVEKVSNSAIKSLSGDMMFEILSRVGSTSFTDLYNAKLCCREFRGAAEEDKILEKVCMDKFPLISWTHGAELISFLNRCKENGNPEALYRQGMIEYFSSTRTESGLENLKRASEKGHAEASYVYGIILLCKGGQSKQEGLKLLNEVMSSNSSNLRMYRRSIQGRIWRMWIKNKIVPEQLPCGNGNDNGCIIIKKTTWDPDDEDYDFRCCEACRWNEEVVSFCKMLHHV